MTLAKIAFFALLTVFSVSCASTASLREKRVETNPQIFRSLSAEDQALVSQGKLRDGMSKEAVFLAWGRPDDIRQGSKKGVPYETWVYSTHVPHSRSSLSLGYGFTPYYRGYGYPGFGFYPAVTTAYIPVKVGQVEFLNGEVVAWEIKAR